MLEYSQGNLSTKGQASCDILGIFIRILYGYFSDLA